jgi:hypothetical protein
LYKEVRPHSSFGYLTPNEFGLDKQPHRPVGQWARALRYVGLRPDPLLNPLREEHMQQAREAVSS